MYLKSLELTGFKSFAKKTTLEFRTPITAIVGPNGSGKSNIAEAFQFVLGEQSVRSMRGKRGEDLIWNGGADTPRSNRAAVKVTLDNRQKLLPVDFEEVSVERVIYRDGTSEYILNGSVVRLRDIVELFAAAHIGSSGHHIISQGAADRILTAGNRERREMVEDALGLKVFQWKRQESERKLERTEENVRQVEALRREVLPHIKFLKKQVERLEKAETLRKELSEKYGEYLFRESVYISETERRLRETGKEPRERLRELEVKLEHARTKEVRGQVRESGEAHIRAAEERLAAAREKKEAVTRTIGRLEGEKKGLDRISLPDASITASVPISEIERIERDVAVEAERTLLSPTAESLRSLALKIRKIFSELLSRYRDDAEKRVDARVVEESRKSITAELRSKETELAAIRSEEEKALEEVRRLRDEGEKEREAAHAAEREVYELTAELERVRSLVALMEAESSRFAALKEDFLREVAEGRALVGEAVERYKEKLAGGGGAHTAEILAEPREVQANRRREIEKIKIKLEDLGGGGSEEILKEYREVSEREAFLERELADLEKSAVSLRELIKELTTRIHDEFRGGIVKINEEFQRLFTVMFGGGSAKLVLVKEVKRRRAELPEGLQLMEDAGDEDGEEEEVTEGVEIEVNLPRKKIKGLIMLSGGERALTSIALLFAISQVKPPPFIILDETDAALDEANSRKYGDMVESLSARSQLILITHNRETMSRAGVLYGVTMDRSGTSRTLSVVFEDAVKVAK